MSRYGYASQSLINLKWEEFTHENGGNGGHEIYRLLSEMAVSMPGVPAETAALMRSLNKTFKTTIDPLICAYMVICNATVAGLQQAITTDTNHKEAEPPRPRGGPGQDPDQAADQKTAWTAWKNVDSGNEALVCTKAAEFDGKFGYHTTMTLKKCMTICAANRGSVYGWVTKPDDVPRLGATVHCFLAMAGKHTCELCANAPKKGRHCECSNTIGGGFSYVPHGNGLIMHCCSSCIESHSIILNPSSGTPLVQRSRHDPQNESMLEVAKAMLTQVGVHSPFGRDPMRARFGDATWQIDVHNVHNALLSRLCTPVSSAAVRFLLLDHPTIDKERQQVRRCPTFQSLLRITPNQVETARVTIREADDLERELASSRRGIMRQHGAKQINRIMKHHGSSDGVPQLDLDFASNMLPGSRQLIDLAVLDVLANYSGERTRDANVLSHPFTMRIISAVVLGVGSMRRYDQSFSGSQASNFAYSYITGLCAGTDSKFDVRELSAQLNLDLNEPNVSIACWRDAITTMHVFDAIDYASIRVVQCPQEQIMPFMRDYNGGSMPDKALVLKWSFDVGGLRLTGPLIATPNCGWYSDKKNSGEYLLTSLGYRPEFFDVPDSRHFRSMRLEQDHAPPRPTPPTTTSTAATECVVDHSGSIKAFTNWFQHTAQHLCARPEARAMGLDILTGDRTRMLIKLVGESNLDPECVAAAGTIMQVDEAADDAKDA